jgi:hypothetical protein
MTEFRRHGMPALFYLPIHALEAENAIRQKAFYRRRSLSAQERRSTTGAPGTMLSRLQTMLKRKRLIEIASDWDSSITVARALSRKHTEATGVRTLDLLHVAFALELKSEIFFSTDQSQAKLAKAEGLKVVTLAESVL